MPSFLHKISFALIVFCALCFPAFSVFAEPSKPVDVVYRESTARADVTEFGLDSKSHSLGEFLQSVLQFFFSLLGSLALLGMVVGGGMIMIGGASKSMAERGKSVLLYSAIGVGIAMLAYIITTLAQTFFYSFDG